jgi:hypothetical protein
MLVVSASYQIILMMLCVISIHTAL